MRRRPETERLYEIVGQKVERRRREAKLTQAQLARLCGLARGSIANIENGNQRPTIHTLWDLAEALEVDMRSLLPSPEEFLTDVVGTERSVITGRLEKAAGGSRNQVASFIASSRAEVMPDVSGEDG